MSAVSVFNDTASVLTRGVPDPNPVNPPPPPPPGSRFFGDVGVGKIRLGATDGQNSIASFDALIFGSAAGARQHSTTRSYNNDSANGGKAVFRMPDNAFRQLIGWINEGRMPMWSFKGMEVVAGAYKRIRVSNILNGSHDADLDYNFAQCDKLPGPLFVAYWHEPEDDHPVVATTALPDTADDYRAASQYIIRRWKAGNHKNIVWCSPFFMAFTFKPASGRDFRKWHPNWDGTKWIDLVRVDGVDFYNPQAGVSAGDINDTWATQATRFINARARVGAPALPWIIGELGLMNQYPSLSSTGITVPQFMVDMVTTGGGAQGLVAVCIWNNDGFAFLPGTDPGAEKTNGWKAAVKLSNVVLA